MGKNRRGKLIMEIAWIELMAPDRPGKGGDGTTFPTWAMSGKLRKSPPNSPNFF